jgi:glycosyltransferase involved in cell wall biosynthesis
VKLLFVSGEYPPDVGGIGDYTDRLRRQLSSDGLDSRILSRRDVHRWDARSIGALLRVAPRDGVAHIQFQAGAFDLLGDVCLMPALLRFVRPRVRVATTFHDTREPYLFPRAGAMRRVAVRLLADTSHAVIAADSRDLSTLGGPSPRHHNVPIGPNVTCSPPPDYHRAALRSRLGLGPDSLAVAYFGTLNASKGLDTLLDAFEWVAKERPDARLLLLGGPIGASDPTDRRTAAALTARLASLGQRAIRTGWLAPEALSAHLLAADVALLPYADGASARRGSLLACAEHGLPIVSTRPAAPEVAAAVHATDASAAALAEAVIRITADPALSRRLREASRALAARMSWPHIAAAHVAIYDSLASA